MIQFGTGGWRAVIGDEFTRTNIQLLATALANKQIAEGHGQNGIVVGYDRRFLSKEAAKWICEVMAAKKILCWFVNRSVPTPLIMFYVMQHGLPYGCMVTASHNPAIYNGIKVFTAGGRDADEHYTTSLEEHIAKVDAVETVDYNTALAAGLVVEINPMDEYLDSILDKLNMEAIKKRHLRVVFDPMYGVSKDALSTILISGRCDLEVIHQEHDTLFGGKMPTPTKDTLHLLQNRVTDYGFDLGIATDGDADRLGVIDETGRYLHPNEILAMLYYYLLRYCGRKGDVVRNLATTHVLDRIASDFGYRCHEVPVGFKHISAKMTEVEAILGGESSGGLTVCGHISGKDGVYAAALIVEMLAVSGKRMSDFIREIEEKYGRIYMEERDLTFAVEQRDNIERCLSKENLTEQSLGFTIERISYQDGCKVYFDNGGWIIARFSGTEPLLRIFAELPNPVDAGLCCDRLMKLLQVASCVLP